MALIGSLIVNLKARTASFNKSMKKARFQTKQFSLSLKGIAAAAGLTVGLIGLTRAFKSVVSAASVAEESLNKFNTVFKEEAPAAKEFAENLSKAVGRSKNEIITFLASLQDTFVPLGFARKEARKMSQEVTKLAIDLASFNDTTDEEALQALQSALVGNHRAARRFGIVLLDSVISLELMNSGVAESVQHATELEKAQARLNIIMNASKDAQGDAIRTARSFANMLKRVRSQFMDLQVTIGNRLLPKLSVLLEVLSAIIDLEFDDNINDVTLSIEEATVASDRFRESVFGMLEVLAGVADVVETVGRGFEFLRLNITLVLGALSELLSKIPGVEGFDFLSEALGEDVKKGLADFEKRVNEGLPSERLEGLIENIRNRIAGTVAAAAGAAAGGAAADALNAGLDLTQGAATQRLQARSSRFLTGATGRRQGIEFTNKLLTDQNSKTDVTNELLRGIGQAVTVPVSNL